MNSYIWLVVGLVILLVGIAIIWFFSQRWYRRRMQINAGEGIAGQWKTLIAKLTANKQNLIGYGLCICFAFAILGQWFLSSNSLAIGLIFYALAAVIFVTLLTQAEKMISEPRKIHISWGSLRQPGLILIPLLLSLVVIRQVYIRDLTPKAEWVTLISWLVDIFLFCAIVLFVSGWRPMRISALSGWLKSHRLEFAGIVLLVVIAFSLRIVNLQNSPFPPNNDDGEIGAEALNFARGLKVDFFGVGWSSQPNLSFVLPVPMIDLFGNNVFAIRVVSAIEGALTVIFLYFLARQEFGVRIAFLASGALVSLPIHLHFSRLAVNNIIPGFFAALSVWLFTRALRTRRTSSYLWAGLAVGFAFYTYLGSRLAMALVFGLLLYVILTKRRMISWTGVWVFVGIILIVIAPMVTFFVLEPNHFMARMNAESIFANNWMPVHSASLGISYSQIILDQISKSSLVFITGNAPEGFFNSSQPYFPMVASIFLVLGMAYAIIKIRQPIYLTILAWFWSTVILGSAITVNAPSSERLIMSLPAAALFVGLGIDLTFQSLEKIGLVSRRWGWIGSLLLVSGIAIYGAFYYFGDYLHNDMPKDYPNQAMIGGIYQETALGPSYSFYLLARPTLSLEFGNFRYLLAGYDKKELTDTVPNLLEGYNQNKGALFMALPEQLDNLKLVELSIPGGVEKTFNYSDDASKPLFYTYVVPPGK